MDGWDLISEWGEVLIRYCYQFREVRRVNDGEGGQSAAEWRKLPFTSASHSFPSEQFQVKKPAFTRNMY